MKALKRNTVLTSAVILALGCAGAASAGQDTKACVDKASELKMSLDQSVVTTTARAELETSLTEAQSADLARCEQIVARVEREIGGGVDETAPHESSSPTESSQSSTSAAESSADVSDDGAYERGHASAEETLPDAPGDAANTSTGPAVSPSGQPTYGYASPNATMSGESSDADASTAQTGTSAAGHSLAGLNADDLVDKKVESASGEEVGEITAIVTDKGSSDAGYAVISFGGMLGIGDKQVLLALEELDVAPDGTIKVPAQTAADFEAYPEYVEDEYEDYDGAIANVLE